MRYLLSVTTSALLLLSGCAKDSGSTLVTGQVVDQVTGQPVAGTTVQVEQRQRGSSGGGYSAVGPVWPWGLSTPPMGRGGSRFASRPRASRPTSCGPHPIWVTLLTGAGPRT
ncbi:hypothetical protein J7E24_17035 [Hymenobacter sp. ISL-91]|uniref:hypothetical protein n=1 Tax=Hymenobacter sp. ISL-91 TaxID=2819151 RepID=UPI001BE4F667|nr:hypothetical protein [Hymenobacter sp. ISL-91]MBT2559494.1 hypothetical protein [Hymenobacter sp. ISL-91]